MITKKELFNKKIDDLLELAGSKGVYLIHQSTNADEHENIAFITPKRTKYGTEIAYTTLRKMSTMKIKKALAEFGCIKIKSYDLFVRSV